MQSHALRAVGLELIIINPKERNDLEVMEPAISSQLKFHYYYEDVGIRL